MAHFKAVKMVTVPCEKTEFTVEMPWGITFFLDFIFLVQKKDLELKRVRF